MNPRLRIAGICIALLVVGAVGWHYRYEITWFLKRLPVINRFFRPTIAAQIAAYGPEARGRLAPMFEGHGLEYPPDRVSFIAIKSTKELLVYAAAPHGSYQYVCTYPILGASGHLGPKLRSGDRQVPEGIYELTLEPNTPYHLALRLNYPNETDIARARTDGRDNPGSDILIHGTTGSVGCIAVGDRASEDLFVLVHDTCQKPVPLIIAPVDLRTRPAPDRQSGDPAWLGNLYDEVRGAMSRYPKVGT